MRRWIGFVVFLWAVLMVASTALAQNAQVTGTVKDTSGGVMPGVTVTAKNNSTGLTRTEVTDVNGNFRLVALLPGSYTVTVEIQGFTTQSLPNVILVIDQTATLELVMKPATVSENVTVTGESPIVDVTRSDVGTALTTQQIQDLPVAARRWIDMAMLTPGSSQDAIRGQFYRGNVSIGAGVTNFYSTGNVVDGVNNTWVEQGETRQNFPMDAIDEFKVSTSSYKAEYGLATGGVVNVVTIEPTKGSPTYRVRALDASGTTILNRDFTVTTVMRPYNGVFPQYEQVEVDTGWVRMQVGTQAVLDQRIETDLENLWNHYQTVTLPKIYHTVMKQAHGNLKREFVPMFDTLKIDAHLSEPEYWLGLDKERIAPLEDFQEDIFYSTENFMQMLGRLESGQNFDYPGRIIPVVHPPAADEGKDGHVRIEFYAKPEANPLVRLSWTDGQGRHQERERDIPVVNGRMMPRLIQAQVKAGSDKVQNLTWLLPADFMKEDYADWLKVADREQVDRSIFSVEKAQGELHWLDEMHKSGLYRDDLAYPHLEKMSIEFDLPLASDAPIDTPAERSYASWPIPLPVTRRPMIADHNGEVTRTPIVQWQRAISPAESAGILARFATYPGVNVYWMGRSYLGENIWAADVMEPSPSVLRSWAKLTTLKAVLVLSARQHANEVSSTSHVDKLVEQLLTDPKMRESLKQVNVVLHPITNPDGAQLSVDLAAITPDHFLHPGYHGSLAADVSENGAALDPLYPETRTRKQLIDAWLPDSFLNPHGYPSHEWIQPFSEYEAWVQTRVPGPGGRAYWIPRGWYSGMNYLRDERHPYSKAVAYAIRDLVAKNVREAPGLLELEKRMNARYARYGKFAPDYMTQPFTNDIRIYSALKGNDGTGGRGGGGGEGPSLMSPDITWDSGGTEAPDETAHDDYMALVAGAGLAFDKAHLQYLAEGKLRITRTQRAVAGGILWQVSRARPIVPATVMARGTT